MSSKEANALQQNDIVETPSAMLQNCLFYEMT